MNIIKLNCNKMFIYKVSNLISIRKLSSTEYCLDTIKKHDYENFICTLLLKNEGRACSIAIRAFNVEISKIQDQISDSKIGLMRITFWEEALEKCFRNENMIPNHPVVLELNKILKMNKFTKRFFQSLINSRKDLMHATNFQNLQSMETYAEQSVSSAYYLILEGCNIRNVNADHAASHLGKAQGLCQLIRSIPLIRHKFISLPQDLMSEFKISHEDVIRAKNLDGIKECVFKVATRANQHLDKMKSMAKSVPVEAKPVLLPTVAVDHYLQRLLKVDFNIFDTRIQNRNLTWIPVVWWKRFRNTF